MFNLSAESIIYKSNVFWAKGVPLVLFAKTPVESDFDGQTIHIGIEYQKDLLNLRTDHLAFQLDWSIIIDGIDVADGGYCIFEGKRCNENFTSDYEIPSGRKRVKGKLTNIQIGSDIIQGEEDE